MTQPTPFDRQTSFAQFSANYPSRPHNGSDLDAEFNAVKIAMDETQANLALIQDDDGRLARGSVGRSQLDSSITIGFENPEPWAAGISYTEDLSTVWFEGKFYSCIETHTSDVTFDPLKWFEIADLSAAASIPDGSITEAKLAESSVTASKIQNLAVSTSKIASNAVTLAKLGASVPQEIANLIIPIGLGPLPWPGATAPTGWVFTGTHNRADRPALWAFAEAQIALGSTWFTNGNGTTTFTIATMDGIGVVGVDAAATTLPGVITNGATTGTATKTIAQGNLPNVNFNINAGATAAIGKFDRDLPNSGSFEVALTNGGDPETLAVTGTAASGGSGTPLSVVQPVRAAKFIFFAGF